MILEILAALNEEKEEDEEDSWKTLDVRKRPLGRRRFGKRVACLHNHRIWGTVGMLSSP